MNKRIVSALVLAGMIAATSAFASKARTLVLGQGGAEDVTAGYGSFYYEDAYNMFYNPAYINDFKNWAGFEKGNAGSAEFGFASSMMNYNMGLYFNRKSGTPFNPATGAPQIATGTQDASVVDLMFGGDMGVKWGLGMTYGHGLDNTGTTSSSSLSARLGASIQGLDPFIGVTILGNDSTTGTKVTDYSGYNAGVRYHYGEWTPYAFYGMAQSKVDATGDATKGTDYGIGLGRETKLAEGARLVYALYYKHNQTKDDAAGVTGSSMAIPMNVGIEADALSWLTLRAGVNQTLIGNGQSKLTTARVGGTFHVAKVDLDYAFGNGTNSGEASDSPNVGFDSETFHQVSMRYSW